MRRSPLELGQDKTLDCCKRQYGWISCFLFSHLHRVYCDIIYGDLLQAGNKGSKIERNEPCNVKIHKYWSICCDFRLSR